MFKTNIYVNSEIICYSHGTPQWQPVGIHFSTWICPFSQKRCQKTWNVFLRSIWVSFFWQVSSAQDTKTTPLFKSCSPRSDFGCSCLVCLVATACRDFHRYNGTADEDCDESHEIGKGDRHEGQSDEEEGPGWPGLVYLISINRYDLIYDTCDIMYIYIDICINIHVDRDM